MAVFMIRNVDDQRTNFYSQGTLFQDSFVKLYFVHDDMVHVEEGARPHLNRKTIFVQI